MRNILQYPSLMQTPFIEEANPDPGQPRPVDQNTPHRNFARRAKHAAFLAVIPALFFTNTTGQASFPEQNVETKVSVQAPVKIDDQKRLQYLYPSWQNQDESHLGDPKFVSDAERALSKSYHPDIVFDKKRIQYTYPSMMPIDTKQLTLAEDVAGFSKARSVHPDIVFDKKRQQYTYPSQETIVKPTGSSTTSACTAYRKPTSTVSSVDAGAASSPDNMWADDAAYVAYDNVNDSFVYGTFGDFGIPANATIKGVKVRVEGKFTGAGVNHTVDFYVRMSGILFSGTNATFDPSGTTDEIQDLGGETNLWGASAAQATVASFADGTFRTRTDVTGISVTTIDIDYHEVSVCYDVVTDNWDHPAEVVTLDKWERLTPDIVFDKKRLQYTYPYWFSDPSHLGDASVFNDLYPQSYPDVIFDKARTQYTYPFLFQNPHTSFGEVITQDKWSPQYPDIVFDQVRRQDLFPSFFIDPYQLTQAESVVGKWSVQAPDIIFDKKREQFKYPAHFYGTWEPIPLTVPEMLPALYQTNTPLFDQKRQQWLYPSFFTDPAHLGDAETLTMDKWLRLTPDIVWDKKRAQYLYPPYANNIDPNILPAELIEADKWTPQYPDIIFDKKRMQFVYPYFWIDPEHLLDAERTDVEIKWHPQRPDIVFDKKRQQYTYPYLFIDPKTLTGVFADDMVAAWGQKRPDLVFDQKRLQWLYPSLFYYDGLIIVPCPPQTDWEPATPSTADWEPATKNTTGWSVASANKTGWTKPTPPTTDWEVNTVPTTDWEESC